MGSGIDLARESSPHLAKAMDDMKDQLLIVLVQRLGGKVEIPVADIDATGGFLMYGSLDPDTKKFTFEVAKKS